MKQRFLDTVRLVVEYRWPGWAWSSLLLILAVLSVGSTFFFIPITPDQVTFLGMEPGPGCGFMEVAGLPCPSCGMTRAWVHTTRGHPITGFLFNPAGSLLLWWIVVAGILGAVRLVTGNHRTLRVPPKLLAAWAIFWLFVPYSLLWILRMAMGLNILPEM